MTIGQKAERIMLQQRPCVVLLKDGRPIECERIREVGPAVVASHSGTIEVTFAGKPESLSIDDIQDIQ